MLHLMDLPSIFSKGCFIYLRKLVLTSKHTLTLPPKPLTKLTRKYDMYSNLVTLIYPSTTPSPVFPTHLHSYMHALPRVSFVWRDLGDPPTVQQIGLSPHVPPTVWPYVYKCWFYNFHAVIVLFHFVQNAPPPLSKS